MKVIPRVGCIRSLDNKEMITLRLDTVLPLRSFLAVHDVCPQDSDPITGGL